MFKISILEHPLFRRKGNDLEMDLKITLKEVSDGRASQALLGFVK